MTSPHTVTIGSRGSDLALWQANYIRRLLIEHHPAIEVRIEIISTKGDRDQAASLAVIGGKGAFTKEIETALLDRSVDIAVHSLKDLPTEIEPGLAIAAVPKRAPVEDVLLSNAAGARLLDLPEGAVIATGSLRRRAQLLAKRPDFKVVDIRGNVPTRIEKLKSSEWDGMLLARAGVERLGLLEYVREVISLEWVLPAVGQGALGIQTRADDESIFELLYPLNDDATLAAVTAERALLKSLGGGCQVPIGAFARPVGAELHLDSCVASLDGRSVVRASHSGPVFEADQIGRDLAATLLRNGADEILREVYRVADSSSNAHPELT
jgi:hydroxymethylbilane synthase